MTVTECAQLTHAAKFVAIYLRISSTDTRLGVERQLAACKQLAEMVAPGVELRVFEDNDTSAGSEKIVRPSWRRLIEHLGRGEIVALIGWHQDRMFRIDEDFTEIKRIIKRTKTPIYCPTQGQIDLSSATGGLVAGLVQRVSEYELAHQRERADEERAQRLADGKWNGGSRPLGFDVVKINGQTRLEINEDEAAALKSLAAVLLDGLPMRAAAREFNEQLGLAMSTAAVRKTIMRPALAGKIVHHGKIVGDAHWSAIIDEQTHLAIVALLSDPTRRTQSGTARKHLGAGLFVCGVCGAAMTSNIRNTGPTYVCRESYCVSRNMAHVDAHVLKIVELLLLDERVIVELTKSKKIDVAPLLERRRQLDAAATRLAAMVSSGLFTVEQATAGAADANRERAEIDQQLARAAQHIPGQAIFTAADPLAAFVAADLDGKRAVISQLVTVKIKAAGRNPRFDRSSVEMTPKLAVELPALA